MQPNFSKWKLWTIQNRCWQLTRPIYLQFLGELPNQILFLLSSPQKSWVMKHLPFSLIPRILDEVYSVFSCKFKEQYYERIQSSWPFCSIHNVSKLWSNNTDFLASRWKIKQQYLSLVHGISSESTALRIKTYQVTKNISLPQQGRKN